MAIGNYLVKQIASIVNDAFEDIKNLDLIGNKKVWTLSPDKNSLRIVILTNS